MMFTGAIPAIVLFLMLFFIRNSPRWLLKENRVEEARKTIEDLSSHEIDTEKTIADIQESIHSEKIGKSINLFKKPFRRIIFIGIFVGIFNQLTGIGVVFYYSSHIFSIAGFSSDSSMLQSVILGVTNLIFTLIAMLVIDKVGRKKILLIGQTGMFIVLGLFGYGLLSGTIEGFWLVALLVSYIAFFASSQGAVVWVLLSEMFPNVIRARGASVGSLANWMVSAALNFLFPVVIGIFGTTLAAQQKGLGFSFIFLASFTFIGFIYLKKHIIETKGKTLEQIEKEVLS